MKRLGMVLLIGPLLLAFGCGGENDLNPSPSESGVLAELSFCGAYESEPFFIFDRCIVPISWENTSLFLNRSSGKFEIQDLNGDVIIDGTLSVAGGTVVHLGLESGGTVECALTIRAGPWEYGDGSDGIDLKCDSPASCNYGWGGIDSEDCKK